MFVLSLPQGVDCLPSFTSFQPGFPQRAPSKRMWQLIEKTTEELKNDFVHFLMGAVQRQAACVRAYSDLFKCFAWKCQELLTYYYKTWTSEFYNSEDHLLFTGNHKEYQLYSSCSWLVMLFSVSCSSLIDSCSVFVYLSDMDVTSS